LLRRKLKAKLLSEEGRKREQAETQIVLNKRSVKLLKNVPKRRRSPRKLLKDKCKSTFHKFSFASTNMRGQIELYPEIDENVCDSQNFDLCNQWRMIVEG